MEDLSVLAGVYGGRESVMYAGPWLLSALCINSKTLKSILWETGSQWRVYRTGVMCSLFFVLVNSLAAEFWMSCNLSMACFGSAE